jgi:putative peptidoglycan lipid II flippase
MQRWPFGTTDSLNRKIFRTAVVVGLFTLLFKIGTTAKELVVARIFGRSDALDAFLIAFLLPGFVLGLLSGAFASAMIPALVDVRQKRGPQAAQQLFSSAMLTNTIALAAMGLLLGLLAPFYLPYLASGFSPAKLLLTRQLLYVLLPFVLFNGLAACASAVLNASEKFALPALVPLLTPLLTILFIVLGAGRFGPFVLAGGLTVGSLIEAALLARLLQAHGMSLRLRWGGFTPEVRRLIGQYVPMLAGTFLMSSTGVVDQSMAAILAPGSVAALGYGNKVISLLLTIGASSLSTAMFPHLSKMLAQNDWGQCRHTLKRYLVLAVLVTVPLTAFLIAFSRPLVGLLYQRGAFTAIDADLVSKVQAAYALQIPFNVCGLLLVRFLSAVRRNDVLMYASGINLVLDIVLNLLLMRRWGVAGIALSTSLVYVFSFFFVAAWSLWLMGQHRLQAGSAVAARSGIGPEAAG